MAARRQGVLPPTGLCIALLCALSTAHGKSLREEIARHTASKLGPEFGRETEAELRFLQWLNLNGAEAVLPGHAKLQIMHPVPRHAQAQEQHHHRHRGSRQESEDAPQAGTDAASSLSDTERGLGAAVDIGAGEAVFSVPLSTALVVLDEVDVEPSADAPAYLRLIAKLLGEVAKGNRSAWGAYLNVLPRSVPVPWLALRDEDMAQIQLSPTIRRLRALQRFFKSTHQRARAASVKIRSASYEQFLWAFAMFLTRHFVLALPMQEGEESPQQLTMLMPFGDLINHRYRDEWDQGDLEWEEEVHEEDAVLRTRRPLRVGQQAFEIYLRGPAEVHFLFQGFVPDPNPHNTVVLFESLDEAVVWLLGHLRATGRLSAGRREPGKKGHRRRRRRWSAREGLEGEVGDNHSTERLGESEQQPGTGEEQQRARTADAGIEGSDKREEGHGTASDASSAGGSESGEQAGGSVKAQESTSQEQNDRPSETTGGSNETQDGAQPAVAGDIGHSTNETAGAEGAALAGGPRAETNSTTGGSADNAVPEEAAREAMRAQDEAARWAAAGGSQGQGGGEGASTGSSPGGRGRDKVREFWGKRAEEEAEENPYLCSLETDPWLFTRMIRVAHDASAAAMSVLDPRWSEAAASGTDWWRAMDDEEDFGAAGAAALADASVSAIEIGEDWKHSRRVQAAFAAVIQEVRRWLQECVARGGDWESTEEGEEGEVEGEGGGKRGKGQEKKDKGSGNWWGKAWWSRKEKKGKGGTDGDGKSTGSSDGDTAAGSDGEGARVGKDHSGAFGSLESWQLTETQDFAVGSAWAQFHAQIALVERCLEILRALPTTAEEDEEWLGQQAREREERERRREAAEEGEETEYERSMEPEDRAALLEEEWAADGNRRKRELWPQRDADGEREAEGGPGGSRQAKLGELSDEERAAAHEEALLLAVRFRMGQKLLLRSLVREWLAEEDF